jgi:maleate isomerase
MADLDPRPYGYRARIGYTSPPLTTEGFPYEFYQIAPRGVSLVVTSLAIITRTKAELDDSWEISLRAAREMRDAGCDLVCLGGVPINQHHGFATAETMCGELEKELGVKVSSSASAQTAAGRKLGVRKAVLAHPYAETDTARISKSYEHMLDCEVIGKTCWGSPFNRIGAIPQHAAVEMGRKLLKAHPQADTILFPSPHWPTAFALDILEKEFGVTALGAHQGIVWDALRRCGIDDRIEGFGRLLRDF